MVRGSRACQTNVNEVNTQCSLSKEVATSMKNMVYVGGNGVGRTSIYEADVCDNLQRCPVATSATTGQGSVNESLIINEPPVDTYYLPNVETIVDLFNVPLKFLKDIDFLTRRIKAGECEDVMMAITSVERKAVMEAIESVWKKIVYILLFLTKTIQLSILLILWGRTNLLVMWSSLGRLEQYLTEVYGVKRRFFLYFYFIESRLLLLILLLCHTCDDLILGREFKKLKRSRNAIVKVRWNSKRGPEFTWEYEDQMKLKYPQLFSDILYRVDGGDFIRTMVIYGLL
ncbi:hypothetical protein Tco_0190627 [Tanacetum coccineum]